jgi:hypothetical protein
MGETSGSGQPVHRHTERASEPEAAWGDEQLIEEVTAHVERHLGPSPTVNHELVSVDVHVDVLMSRRTTGGRATRWSPAG